MIERGAIRLDRLDVRLKGHDAAAAETLARELPASPGAALTARGPARPVTLADRVAAQVAGEKTGPQAAHLREES